MPAIRCPHCGHPTTPKALRPGRFTPKCPNCGRPFELVVTGNDAALSIRTAPLASSPAAGADPAPAVLGGYQILKELGRGGMGTVYLARQVSLDRLVALKVMRPEWASNPNFLVRFTREAYAAAQLVHHNIVQVYDIAEDRGVHFFSMEYVEGRSLGEVVKAEGRLPADVAAGYVLQAARGLQFAHDRGMVHRDVKPDNLLLNSQGVVKVADLGLVRTPGIEDEPPAATEVPAPTSRALSGLSNVTAVGQAVGTPSYMAPEQARDATRVDSRADVYSLGCTLYLLVTGKPVFAGGNALEVLTKHASEPVARPDQVVPDVPKALADVIVKMVGKRPDDRYPSMAEVIQALEAFLGVSGPASRLETHLQTIDQAGKAFREAPAAQLRPWVLFSFFGGCAALFLVLVLLGFRHSWAIAGGVLGLGVSTALSYLVVHGVARREHLSLMGRDLVLSSSWPELGKVALAVALFLAVLWLFGQLWIWLFTGAAGLALAVAMYCTLDRRLAAERAEPLEKVERMLRELRRRGLSEEALQEMVARHAGEPWEEFFEALFGYEAKLAARARYGGGPRDVRSRYAGWRDPIVHWIDRHQRRRQAGRERLRLQAVEQQNLLARGVGQDQARAQAEAVAEEVVRRAEEVKQEVPTPERKGPPRRIHVHDLLDVEVVVPPRAKPRPGRALGEALASLFGGSVRFLVGVALVLICLWWLHRNQLLPSSADYDSPATYSAIWAKIQGGEARPLPLPEAVRDLFNSINPGVAGLILVLSSIWRHWQVGLLVLLGAAVMVLGPAVLTPTAALVLGGGVAAAGFVFGRGT
ncbi:MAG: protein kinase [Gemmataceae bacterium]